MQCPLRNKDRKGGTREADRASEGGKGKNTWKLCLKQKEKKVFPEMWLYLS